MERKENYEYRKKAAEERFLTFDQQLIAERMQLEMDDAYLYTEFLGSRYRINRKTGKLEFSDDEFVHVQSAGFEDTLSIFDLLCHGEELPVAGGNWAPVNSLKGKPKTIGVDTGFYKECAKRFDADPDRFAMACEHLGGKRVPYGDIGYEIPVYKSLHVILKFYHSDDEFPAQLVLLWDEEILQYAYYETVFYMMNALLGKIEEKYF